MVVYIDYILVYLRTSEEHASHLREVLRVLKKNELYAKLSKCEFLVGESSLFGAHSV